MGQTRKPLSVKLIVGFIFQDEYLSQKAEGLLSRRFGALDFRSQISEFNHTDYYKQEFGKSLKRKFISFSRLIQPDDLARIKLFTNFLEKKLSVDSRRTINIDPGYLDLAKLVLVSTKDYRHRIYLGQGIYAEVTLYYQDGTFAPWQWTYPDYRTNAYIRIFNQIRGLYYQQLHNV
jgi:hypothetical protein